LAFSAIGSFVAGTIATILLTVMAPIVVELALKFGPAEYFSVMVLAFTTVSAVLGASAARGLASLFFGLTIGLIGLDSQTGQARFTLGIPELLDGIDVVVVAVGLFAVGETLYIATYLNRQADTIEKMKGSIWMNKSDWRRSWKAWLRGTALGFPFGTIPAGGAEIPTFLSYAIEKKLSRHPEEFGKGAIEGVAGPEAANNASATGTLVPLLTLGLPTTATAAIILAAFQQWGLQPGPLLFETQPLLIWGLIASMYTGNVILLILNLPLVGIWIKLLEIPRPLLYAGILIFATLGAYGLRNSWFDLALLYVVGVIVPDAPLRHPRGAGTGRHDPDRLPSSSSAVRLRSARRSFDLRDPAISATVFAVTALVLFAADLAPDKRCAKPASAEGGKKLSAAHQSERRLARVQCCGDGASAVRT
jgi:putative tricarboxylic transport membrane protein